MLWSFLNNHRSILTLVLRGFRCWVRCPFLGLCLIAKEIEQGVTITLFTQVLIRPVLVCGRDRTPGKSELSPFSNNVKGLRVHTCIFCLCSQAFYCRINAPGEQSGVFIGAQCHLHTKSALTFLGDLIHYFYVCRIYKFVTTNTFNCHDTKASIYTKVVQTVETRDAKTRAPNLYFTIAPKNFPQCQKSELQKPERQSVGCVVSSV